MVSVAGITLIFGVNTSVSAATFTAADITNSATQVFDPANGHIYEFVNRVVSWTDAANLAAASSIDGVHGYLVTITSQAENDFIISNALSRISVGYDGASYWMGASDIGQQGVWKWATGPEAGTQF